MAAGKLGGLHDAPDEGADIGRATVRLHDPSDQPVQVQQVGEQPLELARVRLQAVDQVPRLGVGQVDLGAAEGERDPEDGGERRAQLVGDRIEEHVLHLVQGAQAFGRLFQFSESAGLAQRERRDVRDAARELEVAGSEPRPGRAGARHPGDRDRAEPVRLPS